MSLETLDTIQTRDVGDEAEQLLQETDRAIDELERELRLEGVEPDAVAEHRDLAIARNAKSALEDNGVYGSVGSHAAVENAVRVAVLDEVEESLGVRRGSTTSPIFVAESSPGGPAAVTDEIMNLHEHRVRVSNHDAAEVAARLVDRLGDDPVMNQGNSRGVEYLSESPYDEPSPTKISHYRDILGMPDDFKNFIVVESSEHAQRDDNECVERMVGSERVTPQRLWQERTFGNVEIDTLIEDTMQRFEQPVEQRAGVVIIDSATGRERRPVMDISLSQEDAIEVQRMIQERDAALDRALALFADENAIEKVPKMLSGCVDMLRDIGVLSRQNGMLLEGYSPGGTVADLYIDRFDLAKFEKLDELVAKRTGEQFNSEEYIARGVTNMAAYMFPSGVELMHATTNEGFQAITQQGKLAPRSQVMHGTRRNTQLNGGFVHMTAPGSVAYEYGDIVIGTSIDTIIENSPYLQLEHDYTGNKFVRENPDTGYVESYSTQYKMGKLTINDIKNAPIAFRAALTAMHTNLDKGMRQAFLQQGCYNNYSFAAGNDVDSAAGYQYPLGELSVYATDYEPIRRAIETVPDSAEVLKEITTVAMAGENDKPIARLQSVRPLGELKIPNFSMDDTGGLTVYVPIGSRDVNFTEGHVGNSFGTSDIGFSLETIQPDSIANFVDGMVRDGMSPDQAVDEAMKSVNQKGGHVYDLIQSYVNNPDIFADAHVSISDIIKNLTPDKLKEINYLDIDGMSQDDKSALAKEYGDRMFTLDITKFVTVAQMLERSGYTFSDDQLAVVSNFYEKLQEIGTTTSADGEVF